MAHVEEYYDAVAIDYSNQYQKEGLYDTSKSYPANYFRLQLLLNSFVSNGIKRVIEVGVGEGTPLSTLGKTGIDIWGFDISQEMVKRAKATMEANGMDSEKIFWGDIQDPISYSHALKEGQFDALMAMGVMPHVRNDEMVLENMSSLVRSGGKVFIEFRNKLFSLFTFNRYTTDFILNDLLADVSPEIKNLVEKDLQSRLRMDLPVKREAVGETDSPGYDAILSKFHNPFEVTELFKKYQFEDINLLWYHYHPAMPYVSDEAPELYRREAINLEHEPSDWRGYFLCSAFVVEATKK